MPSMTNEEPDSEELQRALEELHRLRIIADRLTQQLALKREAEANKIAWISRHPSYPPQAPYGYQRNDLHVDIARS